MKSTKLFVIAISVCLLSVFVSGTAYADSLSEIIGEFCAEVQEDSVDALKEAREGNADMDECIDEYGDCVDGGLFGGDTIPECLNEGFRCINFAAQDQLQACDHFASNLETAYERALREAKRSDVEDGFQLWLKSPAGEECLYPALVVSAVCADLIE